MSRPATQDRGNRVAAVLGLVTLVACGVIVWNATPESQVPSEAVLKRRPLTLLEGVHLLGVLAPSVAYVVETSEGLVLIDSGLESDCQSLIQQMQFLKLDTSRLKKILLTHAHGDHVLGAMYLRRLTGAKIHAGRADCDVLRDGGPPEALFSNYEMPDVETHTTEVDVELDGGETIELGDTRIEVIATPGHTPGSVCFLLERDGRKILFTGDTISSITGDLGIYAAYLSPKYRSNAGDYLQTLKRLRAMPAPDVLLPGHPQVGPLPDSPAAMIAGGDDDQAGVSAEITLEHWESMLDEGIRELQTLVDRYDADGTDFLDGTPRKLLPGLLYLGEFADVAVFILEDQDRRYLFDAPGGAGLIEFLEQRSRKLGRTLERLDAVFVTSTATATTAGLLRLVQKFKCPIVVRQEGIADLRQSLPPDTRFLAAPAGGRASSVPVEAIPLNGRGPATVAYRFQRDNKTVLLTGLWLNKLGTKRLRQELQQDLTSPTGDATTYETSLDQLAPIAPNLWLPASPVNGQNANLYDRQWQTILGKNRNALR